MKRFSAIFIAACMVVTAGATGVLSFVVFKMEPAISATIGLAMFSLFVLYNSMSTRLRDRGEVDGQIFDLSRGTADLAHEVSELSQRLGGLEADVKAVVNKPLAASEPIVSELSELSSLVRQIAETVAMHETALQKGIGLNVSPASAPAITEAYTPAEAPLLLTENAAPAEAPSRMSREEIVKAVHENSIDLYLQSVVTLPQRKVRYYEAVSRLRNEVGEIIPAIEFIGIAEKAGLMPKIDNLLVFRCAQILRRLQLKSRDVGLFCNISAATLADADYFKTFLEFLNANRPLAPALVFEFTQEAFRRFGPVEYKSLTALAECGFRFSMDHVVDLRIDPNELAARSFRFLKVPANLLLNNTAGTKLDIHPEDLADLLARSNIDLIAERIESETMVLDLLDYDVRFGQGFLFSPPRPVRAEALQDDAPRAAVSNSIALSATA
jgi:cyclic-di-GMP phosphodiesterase TipF (flagellum assembly factor)